MIDSAYQYLLGHTELFFWIAVASACMLVICIVALPYVVATIPDDYFEKEKRPSQYKQLPYPLSIVFIVAKNLAGLILVLCGIVMLVLPGQGILTLLIGILFLDYPGKYRLEKKLMSYPAILKPINWMRRKRNKREFKI
jgi:hypothetical protein